MQTPSIAIALVVAACALQAAPVTYQFTGTTISTMTVNNGTSSGAVASGTPFSGTLTFDDAQTAAPVAFAGGSHSTYAFTSMSLTIGTSTVTWGPGTIDVYDNLTSSTSGYPIGDSLYVNLSSRVAPGGTINGAQFNFIFLGFPDPTGTAFSSSALPSNLNLASFQNPFLEFNYGTLGTPYGAGNTSMLHFLTTLSKTGSTPTPPPTVTTTSLPAGVLGVAYSAPVTVSAPNGDPTTISVTGLPSGLTFNGSAIVGTPSAVGNSSVTIAVTDTVTKLSSSSTLPLTINDAAITFSPALPSGVANAAYSATFAPATGGTGSFTYSATGLPAGLTLSGNTISGSAAAGVYTVILTATDSAGSAISVPVTLTITAPVPVQCSGKNGVISAWVARTAGSFIVVNGGLNLLDHLWTSNLTPATVTFQGGLVNWYQTGLIVDWTGTVDPLGCILTNLTVRPAVTISTATLPNATTGVAYTAPITVAWGAAPYNVTVSGLPAGLKFDGVNLTGTPSVVGAFNVTVTAVDSVGASASKSFSLTVADQAIAFAPALPAGTVGSAYSATLSATGFGPFVFAARGLPSGQALTGNVISGTPAAAGTFTVTLTATDAALAVATAQVTLTINPAAANYTQPDEGKGKITAIGADYLMVGSKKLVWNASTKIIVNTPNGELHVIDSFVKAGMVAQWKGLRDKAANTVLTSQLEIN